MIAVCTGLPRHETLGLCACVRARNDSGRGAIATHRDQRVHVAHIIATRILGRVHFHGALLRANPFSPRVHAPRWGVPQAEGRPPGDRKPSAAASRCAARQRPAQRTVPVRLCVIGSMLQPSQICVRRSFARSARPCRKRRGNDRGGPHGAEVANRSRAARHSANAPRMMRRRT